MKFTIIGATGLVGQELKRYATTFFPTVKLSHEEEADYVFFCTPATVSRREIPQWLGRGTTVIDLSSAFRHEAPLIIPEINAHRLAGPLIASPNCTTTLMLMALFPLHRLVPISSIVASTYQSASGGGKALLDSFLAQQPPLHHNLYLHEDPGEEWKMKEESRRILEAPHLEVFATCVRVPIPRVHSLSLHVTFQEALSEEAARAALDQAPGVRVDPSATPQTVSHHPEVYIGRLRSIAPNVLELWVLGDQLLKGAAWNALQIAQVLQRRREDVSQDVLAQVSSSGDRSDPAGTESRI